MVTVRGTPYPRDLTDGVAAGVLVEGGRRRVLTPPNAMGGGVNGISLAEGQARYRRDGRVSFDAPPHYRARPARPDEPLDPEWAPFVDNGVGDASAQSA